VDNLKSYQIIFQQGYDFITVSRHLELIIQRIQEFIFVLYVKDKVYAVIVMDDRYKDLFNNLQITLQEFESDKNVFSLPIYTRMKFKHHYAIPFCIQIEPFPLYKVLADYAYGNNVGDADSNSISNPSSIGISSKSNNNIPLTLFIHVYQRNEKSSIASYLRKHDIKRTSVFYAYAGQMRAKLSNTLPYNVIISIQEQGYVIERSISIQDSVFYLCYQKQ